MIKNEIQLNNKSNSKDVISAFNAYIKKVGQKKIDEAVRGFEEAYGRN